jgi:PhzF family phenazine biosynthesis protein
MDIDYLQVSVFTSVPGRGNPAAFCELAFWPTDDELFNLSRRIGLPVTSCAVRERDEVELRWLTKEGGYVRSMCGHGTLAAALGVFRERPELDRFSFKTRGGNVPVSREGERFSMTLPRWEAKPIDASPELAAALGREPRQVLDGGRDLLAVYGDEEEVRALKPDMQALLRFGKRGIIATAPGRAYDCVSRFFCPSFGIGTDEDPVTGSAHCSIAPYWAKQLGQAKLRAYQASPMGGDLTCTVLDDGVAIAANAVLWRKSTVSLV